MIVVSPNCGPVMWNGPMSMPSAAVFIAELSAIAVTIPGSAIGRTRAKLIPSRPKNRWRWTANAAAVPRMSATTVAPSAASTDVRNDSRTWRFSRAASNQRNENAPRPLLAIESIRLPHDWLRESLKA